MTSLRRVVTEVLGRPQDQEPHPDLTLAEVGLDSLSQLEVLNRLEDEFGVTVPYELADQVRSIGDVLDVLRSLTDGRTAAGPAPGAEPAPADPPGGEDGVHAAAAEPGR